MMNWNWHAAGAKKLPDGRLHGASFRYNQCPRHSGMIYNPKLELRNGVVHLPSKGPIIGHYGLEANAMVVAEELGLTYDDISIDLDHHEMYRPFGGGSDGSTGTPVAFATIDSIVYCPTTKGISTSCASSKCRASTAQVSSLMS